MDNAIIQKASIQDILEVATIHKQQFPTHFLGKYSVNLLSAYYRPFLDNGIFLVSKQNGKVSGFVVGGSASNISSARREFLSQNKRLYMMETLLRPNIYWGVLTRLKSAMKSMRETNNLKSEEDRFLILSIAVAKEQMGKGIAQELCYAFEQSISGEQSEYGLYVRCDNKRAITFYNKMGFSTYAQVEDEFYLVKQI